MLDRGPYIMQKFVVLLLYLRFIILILNYVKSKHQYLDLFVIVLRFQQFKSIKNMSSQIANKRKINLYSVLNQFFFVRTISCITFHDLIQTTTICFNCYYLLQSSAYTITIVQQIFITQIFKPQLCSSHTTYLHTKLTEFFLNYRCLFCFAVYHKVSNLMNALEGECVCLREISINVKKLFTLLLFMQFVYVCSCRVVVAYLLVY